MTDFSFVGKTAYTAPSGASANFSFAPPASESAVDLLFESTPLATGDLVFGDVGFVAPDRTGTIDGAFPPLTASIQVVPIVEATIAGTFAPLTCTTSASYSSNTDRPIWSEVTSEYVAATPLAVATRFAHQECSNAPAGWTTFWQETLRVLTPIEHVLPGDLVRQRASATAAHENAMSRVLPLLTLHQQAARAGTSTAAPSQNATHCPASVAALHAETTHLHALRTASWQEAQRWRLHRGGSARDGVDIVALTWHPYQEGVPPPPGIYVAPTPPGPPIGCYTPSPNLLFSWPAGYGKHFIFVCGDYEPPPEGEVVVPVRKVYFMANNLALYRVSDNALVPALSVSLSLDVDSWSWGFSAQLPGAAQSLVEPVSDPVELRVSLNGTDFRVIAESVTRERVFGQTTIRVSGRGRNAALDAPYAAQQVFSGYGALTANQLMEQVLTLNGIPLGWGITFELDDWNVPAGVFNHQGTYITALKAIAEAAGGYLLPHASNQSFTVKHLYPTLPWDWGTVTPNYTLPADVVTRESLEWVEKPSYNRVYVSGQDQGRLGRVTRSGTAGDVLAPMVVDQLITSVVASRQRGEAILADTGKQIKVGLRLPVLTETGVIRPGHFVRYVDGGTTRTGLVRGVSVDSDGVEAWQRLEVETHG